MSEGGWRAAIAALGSSLELCCGILCTALVQLVLIKPGEMPCYPIVMGMSPYRRTECSLAC